MICYRDMTFCDAQCTSEKCHRRLTPEVKAAAKRWWRSDGAPIATADMSGDCPEFAPSPVAQDEEGST